MQKFALCIFFLWSIMCFLRHFKNFLYKVSLKNCSTSEECEWENTIFMYFDFLVWKCHWKNFLIFWFHCNN